MWRIGIAFLLGHCCIHGLAELPPAWPWGGALALVVLVAASLRVPLVVALALGIGWAWANAAARLADDLPMALEGRDLLVSGHIASLPDDGSEDPQFLLDVHQAEGQVPKRIRVSWYRAPQPPQPGELWQLVVRLKRRDGYANPGGFDYEGYLFRAGIGATGYVRDDDRNERLSEPGSGYAVLRARAWLAQRIAAAAAGRESLGILQGLAVGATRSMSADHWRVMAATGTTHLMAISGLHVGMVAALAAFLGGRLVLWRGAQRRRLTAMHGQVIGGLGAAFVYALLAGLSVPTQRALVMLAVYFAARWQRRELRAGRAFGLALIAVLLIDPFAPMSAGAWLSFGAVGVILLTLVGRLGREHAVLGFTRVQLAITLGLAPLLLTAYGGLSLVSPLANAMAIPAFTLLIVPMVLIGALAAALWLPAGVLVLGLAGWAIEMLWPALVWLADLPLAFWYLPAPRPVAFAALAAGVLLLILPGIWPTRFVAVLLCLPALTSPPATPAEGEFELALLDVGQGLAVVVRTRRHVLVYDTGPAFRSGRDTGELVVLPYLRHRGVRRIDMLMVSHGHLDHYGGMRSVLAGMPTTAVVAGPSVSQAPASSRTCQAEQTWMWDGVEFRVLYPGDGHSARYNDSSCVLWIGGAGASALLTGDIERDAEWELVRSQQLVPTEIVVVPHHGSGTSSTEDFVGALTPQVALFGAGYRNRWNFPRADVLERWNSVGASAYVTGEGGAIEVTAGAGGLGPVREYRRERARYWRRGG